MESLRGGAVPLPRICLILGLEIVYYGAFRLHVANISTLLTTYTIYTVNEFNGTHMHRSLTGPEN